MKRQASGSRESASSCGGRQHELRSGHGLSGGFALVEALVAAAILSGTLAAAVSAYLVAVRAAGENGDAVEALYLADEGVEAVRDLRDSGWSANIAPLPTGGTPFYLAWNGSAWATSVADTLIDGAFDRSVTLGSVYRDANGDIAQSGALDPNARRVTVTVSWRSGQASTSRSLSAYVTNLFNN